MNANELMIGDWVMNNALMPPELRKRKGQRVKKAMRVNHVWNCGVALIEVDCFGAIRYEDAKPIRINEKMLKANGFSDRGECGWQNPKLHLTYYFSSLTFFHGIPYEDQYIDAVHNICYVHELQHALRLMKMNLLADNFKLE